MQTVQKLEIPPCSSSTLFTCPLLCVDRCRRCPDSAENREVSARVLGLGSIPVVVQRQVPDGRDSAENRGVSAVGAGSWTRLLTCPCWPRQGVVEVPQLQFIDWCVAAHHGYDELMRRLFRAVYTGTRPGRGRGGGDAGSLLPGVLPPEFGASVVWRGQTRHMNTRSEPPPPPPPPPPTPARHRPLVARVGGLWRERGQEWAPVAPRSAFRSRIRLESWPPLNF